MRRKKIFFLLLIFSFLITWTGCSKTPEVRDGSEPTAQTAFLMGTIVKITIFDDIADENIFPEVFARVQEIEDKMTINKDTDKSEIIKLNALAGQEFVTLSPDTFFVLAKGKDYSVLSQGKFDITIGPLVKLWDIGTEEARVPADITIQEKLPLINYNNLHLNKDSRQAKLQEKGMIVDLGAIAKGYAADEAARILRKKGIEHGIINLGGNILVLNTKPDGSSWRLGLQDPETPRGDYMGIVKLDNQALVSSGTYERYLEQDGKRYHHIIDPRTGYPAANNLNSVSIITKNSTDADALSTTIFLLGLEKGMELIETLPDTEAIFITTEKKVFVSSGIDRDIFQIVKDEYKLQK
ncbi:MAG: FAD:protein FMN transferase [Peptococcaceae bacterium]